jgi:hypothetical protein
MEAWTLDARQSMRPIVGVIESFRSVLHEGVNVQVTV